MKLLSTKLFFITAILFLAYSCTSNKKETKTSDHPIVVKGNIKGAAGKELILDVRNSEGFKMVGKTQIDKEGNYQFKANVKELGFYRLFLTKKDFCLFYLDSAQQAVVNAKAGDLLNTVEIKGGTDNEKWLALYKDANPLYKKVDSLIIAFQKMSETIDQKELAKKIEQQYEFIQDEIAKKMISFIDNNSGSFVSMEAVMRINKEKYFKYYKSVDSTLIKKFPKNTYVIKFHEQIVELTKLMPGAIAPEITMRNPLGKTINLSDLRGKTVLIDFWASWCAPCRGESKNLVKIYHKYKAKGFEIFSVSLDSKQEDWQEAIMKDNLTWTHVSDLKQWDSKAVALYQLQSIPQTYLVDKTGKIIGKSLLGASLEKKLSEIL